MSETNLGLNNKKIFSALAFLVAGLLILLVLLFFFRAELNKNFPAVTSNFDPAQRPQDSPRQQLAFESGELFKETRRQQQKELESYGWVDDGHHFAKVPVERAMQLYLEQARAKPAAGVQ